MKTIITLEADEGKIVTDGDVSGKVVIFAKGARDEEAFYETDEQSFAP